MVGGRRDAALSLFAGALALSAFGAFAATTAANAIGGNRTPEGAEPRPHGRELLVRFHDPYRVLPDHSERRLKEEAVRAFREGGVRLRFVSQGGPDVVPATIYPEIPERWGVQPDAMGVALGSPGETRTVFLSGGATRRALRLPARDRPSWTQADMLGVALGRVLAHELLHVVAPDCPHTRRGLMSATLGRKQLTAGQTGFDTVATWHLRRSLGGGIAASGGSADPAPPVAATARVRIGGGAGAGRGPAKSRGRRRRGPL